MTVWQHLADIGKWWQAYSLWVLAALALGVGLIGLAYLVALVSERKRRV